MTASDDFLTSRVNEQSGSIPGYAALMAEQAEQGRAVSSLGFDPSAANSTQLFTSTEHNGVTGVLERGFYKGVGKSVGLVVVIVLFFAVRGLIKLDFKTLFRKRNPASSLLLATANPKEITYFRFTILAWVFSCLLALYGGYFEYEYSHTSGIITHLGGLAFQCRQELMSMTPECNRSGPSNIASCYAQAEELCNDDFHKSIMKDLKESADMFYDRRNQAFLLAALGFFIAGFVFYGVRWALTGRVRPFWPLNDL